MPGYTGNMKPIQAPMSSSGVKVIRATVGTVGFVAISALLLMQSRPDQRPWILVVLGLIILGSAISVYSAWRRGQL